MGWRDSRGAAWAATSRRGIHAAEVGAWRCGRPWCTPDDRGAVGPFRGTFEWVRPTAWPECRQPTDPCCLHHKCHDGRRGSWCLGLGSICRLGSCASSHGVRGPVGLRHPSQPRAQSRTFQRVASVCGCGVHLEGCVHGESFRPSCFRCRENDLNTNPQSTG